MPDTVTKYNGGYQFRGEHWRHYLGEDPATTAAAIPKDLPVYESNEAAILGGLAVGDYYKASVGHSDAAAGVVLCVIDLS